MSRLCSRCARVLAVLTVLQAGAAAGIAAQEDVPEAFASPPWWRSSTAESGRTGSRSRPWVRAVAESPRVPLERPYQPNTRFV